MENMYQTTKRIGKKALMTGLVALALGGCVQESNQVNMDWNKLGFRQYIQRNGVKVCTKTLPNGRHVIATDSDRDGNPERVYAIIPGSGQLHYVEDTNDDGRIDYFQ